MLDSDFPFLLRANDKASPCLQLPLSLLCIGKTIFGHGQEKNPKIVACKNNRSGKAQNLSFAAARLISIQ